MAWLPLIIERIENYIQMIDYHLHLADISCSCFIDATHLISDREFHFETADRDSKNLNKILWKKLRSYFFNSKNDKNNEPRKYSRISTKHVRITFPIAAATAIPIAHKSKRRAGKLSIFFHSLSKN